MMPSLGRSRCYHTMMASAVGGTVDSVHTSASTRCLPTRDGRAKLGYRAVSFLELRVGTSCLVIAALVAQAF